MLLSPNLIVIGARLVALTEHDGDLGGVRASELTMISALDWECGVGEWIWMRLNIFLGVRYFSAV